MASGPIRNAAKRTLWAILPGPMERHAYAKYPEIMSALDRAQTILIHVPKTGGSSLSAAMYGCIFTHQTWSDWRYLHPIRFRNYQKIAVIRDPVDRFISAYDYLLRPGRARGDADNANRYLRPFHNIDDFAGRLSDAAWRRDLIAGLIHFRPQADFVLSRRRRLMVNRIFPFERTEDAAASVGLKQLPILNQNDGQRSTLTAAATAIVRGCYALDEALHLFALKPAGSHDLFGRPFPFIPSPNPFDDFEAVAVHH